MMTGTDKAPALVVSAEAVRDAIVLYAHGVLEDSTYVALRNKIIGAALDEPNAVVVDVTDLRVPAKSAWSVFSSAQWLVSRWPQVPIILVCTHTAGRDAVVRSGVGRHVGVYPSIGTAVEVSAQSAPHRNRHRARAELTASATSLRRSRELVDAWLTAWAQPKLIAVTKIVVTSLVENVLQHTDSPPGLRLESDWDSVAVAVEDFSHGPAVLRERTTSNGGLSGLRIVAALCRMWGTAPTPTGKTVWAIVGPENGL
jgi:hypothetical protein